MDNLIYSWNFSDKKDRGKFWYILAISWIIWLTIWWILTWLYGLSFVVILVSWVTFFIENNSPDIIEVALTELWIKIADSFYDFSKIESYNFIYDKEQAVLLKLSIKKSALKTLNLKINNKICLELKEILPNYIKEEENLELSKTEKFINFLKL